MSVSLHFAGVSYPIQRSPISKGYSSTMTLPFSYGYMFSKCQVGAGDLAQALIWFKGQCEDAATIDRSRHWFSVKVSFGENCAWVLVQCYGWAPNITCLLSVFAFLLYFVLI